MRERKKERERRKDDDYVTITGADKNDVENMF